MNYKIYTTYHKDEFIDEYNLKNDEYHVMFATHKPINGDNINNVSKYFNEFSTMYYVWKNDLRSDFVGFEHYRRRFDIDRIPNLKEDEVYARIYGLNIGCTIKEQYVSTLGEKDWNIYIDILNKLYGKDNCYVNYLCNSSAMVWDMCYIMAYNKFCKMMKFIWQLVDMFDKEIGANYNYDNYFQFYQNIYCCRAHIYERLVSMWILCNYDNSKIYAENLI